ncbi:hypothetical protein [Nocardia cyriacigeorgica]|nr:hypothetical protein [Nocardia cyriacigeorgica]
MTTPVTTPPSTWAPLRIRVYRALWIAQPSPAEIEQITTKERNQP